MGKLGKREGKLGYLSRLSKFDCTNIKKKPSKEKRPPIKGKEHNKTI